MVNILGLTFVSTVKFVVKASMATLATVLWPAPPAEYFLGDKSVNPNLVRSLVKMGKTAQFHLQLGPIAKHADSKNVWVSEWIL